VYDKSVRRRRITLALLVAFSLLLLTVYFGESAGGGLHSVQKGVLEVVSPIQEGASRALKPVRDLAGWFGDTLDAKSDVDELRDQNAQLRGAAMRLGQARQHVANLAPVAPVIARNPGREGPGRRHRRATACSGSIAARPFRAPSRSPRA